MSEAMAVPMKTFGADWPLIYRSVAMVHCFRRLRIGASDVSLRGVCGMILAFGKSVAEPSFPRAITLVLWRFFHLVNMSILGSQPERRRWP